jgi:lipopolysaccharide/colanic/teichoic acid biosynthesis glycosyltransferase
MSSAMKIFKRAFDVVVALISLLLFSPLIAVICVAIYIDDGSPVLYRQQRIGYHGKPFKIIKFRTMVVDAEADNHPHLCEQADDRLTRVGAFLRSHHLDEFPQLLNVLGGSMSLVGPRPERKYFIDRIMEVDDRYAQLYLLRPGIFSMATLYNGYTNTMEKMLRRLEMDLDYLHHYSLSTDIKIIVLTTIKIISGRIF